MGQEYVFCFLKRLLQSVCPPAFYKICPGSYSSENIGDCWEEQTIFDHLSIKDNLYLRMCRPSFVNAEKVLNAFTNHLTGAGMAVCW